MSDEKIFDEETFDKMLRDRQMKRFDELVVKHKKFGILNGREEAELIELNEALPRDSRYAFELGIKQLVRMAEEALRKIDEEQNNSKPEFTDKQLTFLKDIFTPRCCHITGMHDPQHYEKKKYVCLDQKAKAYDRGRELLGFGEVTPEEAIPKENCFWCNRKKADEKQAKKDAELDNL